jgi:MFS family permease
MATTTPSRADSRSTRSLTRGQARFAFIVLLAINILNYADRSVLAAVQTKIQPEFHLSDTQLGLLASSFLFIYGLSTLPLGVWADRSTRKTIVAICVGIWSIATTLAGFTINFIQLFLARSILGIGEAGYAPASLSMIGDYFPREVRGRILALWSMGNILGTAIGQVLGGLVAVTLGWRWAFYLVGIPGLIAAFLIWRAVEPQRGMFDQGEGADEMAATGHGSMGNGLGDIMLTARRLVKIPTYWVLTGAFIASFFTIGAAMSWINTYIVRGFHVSEAQAGLLTGGTLAIGSIIGILVGGWIADYLQRRMPQGRLLISTISFLVGSPLTFLALSMHDLVPFALTFTVAIICLSLCLGPLNAVIQDIIEPEIRATAVGIVLLVAHLLGDAASPIIIGWISSRSSLGFAFITTAPTCLLIAGLICLLGLRTVARDMQAMQQRIDDSHKDH